MYCAESEFHERYSNKLCCRIAHYVGSNLKKKLWFWIVEGYICKFWVPYLNFFWKILYHNMRLGFTQCLQHCKEKWRCANLYHSYCWELYFQKIIGWKNNKIIRIIIYICNIMIMDNVVIKFLENNWKIIADFHIRNSETNMYT